MILTLAAEGDVDITVAIRLCTYTGHSVGRTFSYGGKSKLDRRLDAIRSAAQFSPWFVLRDLDHDADCAPRLRRLLPTPSRLMQLRIAVRAIESWLLADTVSFSRFFRIPEPILPDNPDDLTNPKQTVLNLVARSKSRLIKTAMRPEDGTRQAIGTGYPGQLIRFTQSNWNIDAARENSPSLDRCVRALAVFSG